MTGDDCDRLDRYGDAALSGLLSELAGAGHGEHNRTLFRVAARVASLAAAGAVEWETAARELEAGALALGHAPNRITATLRSAYRAGTASPASVPDGDARGQDRNPDSPPLVRPAPPEHGPAPRPPQAEVERLWCLARPVTEDSEVSAWLARDRGIAPDRVELYDLARALPPGARLSRWARCQGVPWSARHRLVARGWGATGTVASLHARAVGEPPERLPKGLWPAGARVKGLVLADGWARQILATGQRPEGWGGDLLVAEGLPDFLTVATAHSDANEDAPAVIGVVAGSWTAELAALVPDGSRVIVATHKDGSGDGYARDVVATLWGRMEVRRWVP